MTVNKGLSKSSIALIAATVGALLGIGVHGYTTNTLFAKAEAKPTAPAPAVVQVPETTTHPQEILKNTSMHSRFVAERRFVYGIETHILIDGETGMECVRNAKYFDTPWTCVVTR